MQTLRHVNIQNFIFRKLLERIDYSNFLFTENKSQTNNIFVKVFLKT